MPFDPEPAELLILAERHLRAGRLTEAIDAYVRALAIRSDMPDAWFNLAWAQRAARRFEAALESYEHAIFHGIARPEEARLNRAAIISDHLFRPDLAILEFNAALGDNPRFIPAWLGLGNVLEDIGDPDGAREAYRRALEIDPANGRAHARIAMIEIATGTPHAAVVGLKRVIERAMPVADRAEILFALGSALDEAGDHDEAFRAFEAANWLARSLAPARYDARAQEHLVDKLIAAYPKAPAGATARQDEEASPVFICGMFRSGSTLVEQILCRHAAVTAGGELEQIPALASALLPYPEAAAALSPEQAAPLRAGYLGELHGRGLVTDKRCDNFMHIGLIKTLFPEAKIIHTLRQPLDNLVSFYFLHFGAGVTYGHDLREAAHFYIQYRRLMAHWLQLFPGDIENFEYDRLVATPREEIGRLLAFLNLPWEENCLTPGPAVGTVRTASAWQVRKPLHRRSSGRWHFYERYLQDVRQLLERGEAGGITP